MDFRKIIRNQGNFILGMMFLALGIFLVVGKNLTGKVITQLGGYWANPLTYIRMLGWGFIIFSGLLILMSINYTMRAEVKKFRIDIQFEAVITAIALIVYTIVWPIITFFPATFLLVLGINLLYKRREAQVKPEKTDEAAPVADPAVLKKAKIKSFITSIIYAFGITLGMWLAFSKFLKAVLP